LFATGGDFNGDGIVAAADLVLVRTHWGAVVQDQLAGWVGMQPDDRVDQNELDAVLLNWLQIVDPDSQGGASVPAESVISGEIEPPAPAPLGEAEVLAAADAVDNAVSVHGGAPYEPSQSHAPIPRVVRDAAYSAIAEGRVSGLGGRAGQLAALRLPAAQKVLTGVEGERAGRSERDSAFAQAGTGSWLSIGRIAKR
jgi:hypothetical protein